jgi:hypothetical protein
MTFLGLLGAVGVAGAFGAAGVLVLPAARRHGLGLVHPGSAWLALAGVFFGLGSGVLAATGEASGPALYVAGSVAAFGIGVWASDRLAISRSDIGNPDASMSGPPRAGTLDVGAPRTGPAIAALGTRRGAPVILAAVAIGAIVPVLLDSGIPFLTSDITGARSELVGLPIQLVRVALPGLAGLLLFDALRQVERWRRRVDLAAILAVAGFVVALASRYLVAELAAVLLIAWLVAGRRIPARAVLAIALVALIGFGGIQILRAYDRAGGNELGFAVSRTVNRIVLVQPRTLAALQRAIPADQPYFLGLTWVHRLGPLVGRDDIPNLGYWIYPAVVEGTQDTAGYAAPGLIGEGWANFGPAGLALFVVLGVLAERLGALVAIRRSSGVDIVAGSLATLFLARTHALGLGGLVTLAGVVLAWRILAGPPAGLGGAIRRIVTWRAAS